MPFSSPFLPYHNSAGQTKIFNSPSRRRGVVGNEVDGQHHKVRPGGGKVSVKAGGIHRFNVHRESQGAMTVYLSASDSGLNYQLDRVFFEDWYGYWHDALLHEGKINFI
ncbi:hypothetical protein CSOJ01_12589 [Colletotrichum sojae]|uniref:Uncharacterized protein n=1 Tax=Colletotrichum sojae TaxID=2175907 RepID=A0A8H6MLD6_9PEZI|nr:hypothetical protein CSOJ01_12589 [Colletotrichum sojae]